MFLKEVTIEFQVGGMTAFMLLNRRTSLPPAILLCGCRIKLVPIHAAFPGMLSVLLGVHTSQEKQIPKTQSYKFLVRVDTSLPMKELLSWGPDVPIGKLKSL